MPGYSPHPDIAYRVIDGHVFVITPDSRQHELNGEVELFVWGLCEKAPRTKEELIEAVIAEFDVAKNNATRDLDEFLAEMTQSGVFSI